MSTIATMAVALVAQNEGFNSSMSSSTEVVKGFERTHLSLKSVMESVVTPTERYEKQVEQLSKWHEIGKVNAEQYEKALEKAKESLEKATEHGSIKEQLGEGLVDLASDLLPTIAAAEAIEKTIEHIKEGFEEIGGIGRGAVRLGISPEEFSRLKYAAEVSHVSVETMEADVGKMLNALQKASDGGGELANVFNRLHLNIDQLKELEPAQAFEQIAESISHVSNRAERMNDVREIFGRAGTAILPMIENLRELEAESDKVGFTRTEEEVKAVEEAERNWARATKQVEAAFMDLAAAVTPAISAIAEKIAHAIEGARRLSEVTKLPEQFAREHEELRPREAALVRQEEEIRKQMEGSAPTKRLQQEEELLEVLKKQKDLFAKSVETALGAGDNDAAKQAQTIRNNVADQIRATEKEIDEAKKKAKEYDEFVNFVLEGGGLAEKLPDAKHKAASADDEMRFLFGFTIKDVEQFYKEQERLAEQHKRESERLGEKALRDLEHNKITPLHGEGDFAHRQSDRRRDATELSAGVDPRFLHASDDERADRKKQIDLSQEMVNLLNEIVDIGPAVVDT